MREIVASENNVIRIGRTSENDAEIVCFDVSDWPVLYGAGGAFVLMHQRPGDAQPYLCEASMADDGFLEWTVKDVDVAVIGRGEAQLTYQIGTVVAKSCIFITLIQRSLGQAGELPEPYEDKIDELIETAANITVEANRAEAAKEAAQTAQGKAEDAQTAAETAQRKAEEAQAGAEAAKRQTDAAAVAALQDISDAKTAAVGDVSDAGAAAVLRVQQEGAAQVALAEEKAGEAAASARTAGDKAVLAAGSETAAAGSALKAEGYAVGKQNGVDVQSGSPYYQKNSKYYADQAAQSSTDATTAKEAAQTAQGKAEDAQTAAENAQSGAEDAEAATRAIAEGIAQEPTAQSILLQAMAILASIQELTTVERSSAHFYEELPEEGTLGYVYITPDGVFYYDGEEYQECAGSGGSLNGFSFALNAQSRVVLTYTNPEDDTDTDSAVLPSDSTGQQIVNTLAAINADLETIAGGSST